MREKEIVRNHGNAHGGLWPPAVLSRRGSLPKGGTSSAKGGGDNHVCLPRHLERRVYPFLKLNAQLIRVADVETSVVGGSKSA